MTPEGSTHVDTAFTGTTSSFSRTASGKVAAVAVVRQQVFAEAPWAGCHGATRLKAKAVLWVASHGESPPYQPQQAALRLRDGETVTLLDLLTADVLTRAARRAQDLRGQIERLREQTRRNPIALRLAGTSRAQLTNQITALQNDLRQATQETSELRARATELRAEAVRTAAAAESRHAPAWPPPEKSC